MSKLKKMTKAAKLAAYKKSKRMNWARGQREVYEGKVEKDEFEKMQMRVESKNRKNAVKKKIAKLIAF